MTARAAAKDKEAAAEKAAEAKAAAKADDGMIYIELARTLHGWGEMGQTIHVSADDPEVEGLLENELAVKVDSAPETPDGLQEQPPVRFTADDEGTADDTAAAADEDSK